MKVTVTLDEKLPENELILQTKEKTDAINTIVAYIEDTPKTLTGKIGKKHVMVPVNEFTRFYSSQKKVYGEAGQQEFVLSYRLYELEKLLPPRFVRISNTEIIHLDHVAQFQLSQGGLILIALTNGQQTSSSRRYLKKVKERLQ